MSWRCGPPCGLLDPLPEAWPVPLDAETRGPSSGGIFKAVISFERRQKASKYSLHVNQLEKYLSLSYRCVGAAPFQGVNPDMCSGVIRTVSVLRLPDVHKSERQVLTWRSGAQHRVSLWTHFHLNVRPGLCRASHSPELFPEQTEAGRPAGGCRSPFCHGCAFAHVL